MSDNEQPLIDTNDMKINFIRDIEEFYLIYNIEKIPYAREFNKWIQVHGVREFNKLLMKKYGKDLFSK